MKDQEAKRTAREKDKQLQNKLQQSRQESVMRLVFLALVKVEMQNALKQDKIEAGSDEFRQKARAAIQSLPRISACSLFCKAAVKLGVPVHSNLALFKIIKEDPEHKALIVTHLINPEHLSTEEGTSLDIIKEILVSETFM